MVGEWIRRKLRRHAGAGSDEDRDWMAYIDGEVRAVCEARGLGHQIRRKWSVREKLVAYSPFHDYEWKLIPIARGRLLYAVDSEWEGEYYVLRFDKRKKRFVFQHDTSYQTAALREMRETGGMPIRFSLYLSRQKKLGIRERSMPGSNAEGGNKLVEFL